MNLNAILDIDLVAAESQDKVSVLLELTAPKVESNTKHVKSTLQIVLDRSGSMGDGRLQAAKMALEALLSRLDPTDNFGLVVFDDQVVAAVPAGPLTNKDAVRGLIRSIQVGGTTNLSGGFLRGIQEARRVQGDGSAALLLVSDGHANQGVTDHAELERIATAAHNSGIISSTIGVGLGYDEQIMAGIARGGVGNTHFAEEADAAGAAIASEVEHLLDQAVQATSLRVQPSGDVQSISLFNDLPVVQVEDGFVVEIGDLYSGEERKLLLEIDVPARADLGLTQIAQLELSYVEVGSLDSQTVTMPLHVNVVPGDEAAGRIPNATVRSERAYQEAQRAKQLAADALRSGDAVEAARRYWEAGGSLARAADQSPEMADELRAESQLLHGLSERALREDPSRVAKFSEADRHRKERQRGRRSHDN